jgi:hypothetical protein
MTDLGAHAAQSKGVLIHKGVTWDECGIHICQMCFQENTPKDKGKFVAFHQPMEQIEAQQVFVGLPVI